jgi:hypothetical protein
MTGTNEVETALSETADDFEAKLRRDPGLCEQFAALIAQGQKPDVVRVLSDVEGGVVVVAVMSQDSV